MPCKVIKIENQLKPFSQKISKRRLIKKVWLSKSPVESPSYHNGFPLDLDDHKNNGVATDLFWTVWSVSW